VHHIVHAVAVSRRRAVGTAARSVMLAAMFVASIAGSVQAQPSPRHADTTLLRTARRIMHDAEYAAFITLDARGQPQARTVQPVEPDSAMTVWFATNPHTRKVAQLKRDPRATLHYFDRASLAYVTLLGRARVVTDPTEKAAHWQAAWSKFYPDRDTSVALVEVTPERLEVVDIKHGIEGDKGTWLPPMLSVERSPARRATRSPRPPSVPRDR
jgi:general stress protein 26